MNETAPQESPTVSNDNGWDRSWKRIRDIIIFAVGLLGIIHQTIIQSTPNASLLILFAGMMGIPFVLKKNGGS